MFDFSAMNQLCRDVFGIAGVHVESQTPISVIMDFAYGESELVETRKIAGSILKKDFPNTLNVGGHIYISDNDSYYELCSYQPDSDKNGFYRVILDQIFNLVIPITLENGKELATESGETLIYDH